LWSILSQWLARLPWKWKNRLWSSVCKWRTIAMAWIWSVPREFDNDNDYIGIHSTEITRTQTRTTATTRAENPEVQGCREWIRVDDVGLTTIYTTISPIFHALSNFSKKIMRNSAIKPLPSTFQYNAIKVRFSVGWFSLDITTSFEWHRNESRTFIGPRELNFSLPSGFQQNGSTDQIDRYLSNKDVKIKKTSLRNIIGSKSD